MASRLRWSVRTWVIVGVVLGLLAVGALFGVVAEISGGEPLVVGLSRAANGGPSEFEVQSFGRRVYSRHSDSGDPFVLEQIVFVGGLPLVGAMLGGFIGYRLARRGVARGPAGA